jgi:hypothetical protein
MPRVAPGLIEMPKVPPPAEERDSTRPETAMPQIAPLTPDEREADPANAARLMRALAQLRAQREALKNERRAALEEVNEPDTSATEHLARLRVRLGQLVAVVAAANLHKKPTPAAPKKTNPDDSGELPDGQPKPPPAAKGKAKPAAKSRTGEGPPELADSTPLAHALFRAGDIENALRAFRLVDRGRLAAEDRVTVDYLMATCLRKLGKLDEAAALYRKVGESRRNDMIADCARWQLAALRWRRDVEAQLTALRKQRRTLAGAKP